MIEAVSSLARDADETFRRVVERAASAFGGLPEAESRIEERMRGLVRRVVTPSMLDHFRVDGPAVVSVYTTCQPEHGVGDNMAMAQSKLAVDTRTFPVLIYDPRKGSKISERLSLQGNPAPKEDWYKDPKSGELFDFMMFARS